MLAIPFKLKIMKIERFIDGIPKDNIIRERVMMKYNGTVGMILTYYSRANDELLKEFPDFRNYELLITEANNMIDNLIDIEAIDMLRKDLHN